jgi:hypothetical protein
MATAGAPENRCQPVILHHSHCCRPVFQGDGTNPTGPQTGSLEMNQYEVEAGLGFLF